MNSVENPFINEDEDVVEKMKKDIINIDDNYTILYKFYLSGLINNRYNKKVSPEFYGIYYL